MALYGGTGDGDLGNQTDLRRQVPADAELLADLKREYAEAASGEHAAREPVEATRQVCPYSTATRGNVPVRLVIE